MDEEQKAIHNTESDLSGAETLNTVKVYFAWDPNGNNGKGSGIGINITKLKWMIITESMFIRLPAISLAIESDGFAESVYVPKIGDNIHVELSPNATEKDKNTKKFIKADFCIQQINKGALIDREYTYTQYIIHGILDAQMYINKQCTYPKYNYAQETKQILEAKTLRETSLLNPFNVITPLMPRNTSTEVVKDIFDDLPLDVSIETESNDSSYWMNCGSTYAEFVNKIMDYGWIDENDAPMIFTDLFGTTHYTSIKTMCNNTAYVQHTDKDKKYDQTECCFVSLHSGFTSRPDKVYYTFNELNSLNHSGPIVNLDGNTVKQGFYAPYGDSQLSDTINLTSPSYQSLMEFSWDYEKPKIFHRNHTSTSEKKLANVDGRQASMEDRYTRIYDGGMLCPELHEHYAIAKMHNEQIRRSFFQTFVSLISEVRMQPEEFSMYEYRPRLGKVININAGSPKYKEDVITGKYIITKIEYHYGFGNALTCKIYAANDGIGSLEQIKPTKSATES